MKFLSLALACLCFFLLLIGGGRSNEEAATEETPVGDDTTTEQVQQIPEQLESHPDVVTDFFFPNVSSNRAVGGEPIEVLMTLTNNGEVALKVNTISASLRHPLDYRYVIQNFTTWEYGSVVAPKEEMSFHYVFLPWELEERDYYLSLTAEYQDMEDRQYQSAIFNATFTLTEPPAAVDGRTFFTYCGLITVLILVGFFFYRSRSSPQATKQKRVKVERDIPKEVTEDNEWLVGTPAYRFAKENAKRAKKHQ